MILRSRDGHTKKGLRKKKYNSYRRFFFFSLFFFLFYFFLFCFFWIEKKKEKISRYALLLLLLCRYILFWWLGLRPLCDVCGANRVYSNYRYLFDFLLDVVTCLISRYGVDCLDKKAKQGITKRLSVSSFDLGQLFWSLGSDPLCDACDSDGVCGICLSGLYLGCTDSSCSACDAPGNFQFLAAGNSYCGRCLLGLNKWS